MSASIVLSLFLIFGQFEPHCSYKIVLIKSVNMQRKTYNIKMSTTTAACSSCIIELLFLIDVKTRAAQSFEIQIL